MNEFKKIEGEFSNRTAEEEENLRKLFDKTNYILNESGRQWNMQLTATMRRHTLSRILYYNELYQKVLDTPGVVCEFGVHWGATTSLLINLRGIYEPYNFSRKIIGFDTFSGFPELDAKDGGFTSTGDYSSVKKHYEELNDLQTFMKAFLR